MAELTLEQQQAIAIAQAQRKRAEAGAGEQAQTEGPGGGMSFFNKRLAETFGAPVDVISAGLSKIGIDAPEGGAFGGSQSIRRGMANIGAPTPDRDPETLAENIGSVGGEVGGMILPISKTAQVMSTAPGVRGAIARAINEPMKTIPGAIGAASIETGGVIGAGTARDIAQEQA